MTTFEKSLQGARRCPLRGMVWACVTVACVCAGACGKGEAKNSKQTSSASEDVAAVNLFVGDEAHSVVRASELTSRPSVESLFPDVPYASWKVVVARGPNKARLVVNDPATSYPTKTPRVYLNDDGEPSFGLFDDGDDGGRATLGIRRVLEIAVHTEPLPDEPAPKKELRLSIDGEEQLIRLEALGELAQVRDGDGEELGWALAAVLVHHDVSADIASLVLIDRKGARREVTAEQLARPEHLILKRNRRELYHLQVAPGAGGDRGERLLRDVVRIEVTTGVSE